MVNAALTMAKSSPVINFIWAGYYSFCGVASLHKHRQLRLLSVGRHSGRLLMPLHYLKGRDGSIMTGLYPWG